MPIQAPRFLCSILACGLSLSTPVLCKANVLHYDDAMKLPPWKIHKSTVNNDDKLKEEFAEILLRRPHEPFEAARIVTGDDEKLFGLALVRSRTWPNDEFVKQHQQKLIAEFGARYFLPTKEEMIHEFWFRIRTAGMDHRDAIAAGTLVGNLAGYLTKNPQGEASSEVNFNQSVAITFVSPETKEINEPKIIDNEPINSVELLSDLTFED